MNWHLVCLDQFLYPAPNVESGPSRYQSDEGNCKAETMFLRSK